MTATLMNARRSLLVLVDYQARLMPAIHGATSVLANAQRLASAAALLNVPVVVTEQNPAGIGSTTAQLDIASHRLVVKQSFGACATPEFVAALGQFPDIVLAGCEAHVCVTQTVLGLLDIGRHVYLVRDATGARSPESKETALARLDRHGAEIVTTEMVVFEWLRSSEHDKFKAAIAIIK